MHFYDLYSEVAWCYFHRILLVKTVTNPNQERGQKLPSLDGGVALSHCRKACEVEAIVVVIVGKYNLLHFCLFLREQ